MTRKIGTRPRFVIKPAASGKAYCEMLNSDHQRTPLASNTQDSRVAITRQLLLGKLILGGIIVSSAGCSSNQRAMPHFAAQPIKYTGTVAPPNVARSNSDFATDHAAMSPSPPQMPSYQITSVNPNELAAAMMLPNALTQKQLLAAWEVLDASHLRTLQAQALQSASSPSQVAAILQSDDAWGARATASPSRAINSGPSQLQRQLLQSVAEAYVDVRYHLGRIQDGYENLAIQEQAVAHAKQRKADGKAGRMDVLQAESAVGLTQSMLVPIRGELDSSIKRLSMLTGRDASPAILKGMAGTKQLSWPELDRRLPATVLRQRHDVRSAEQDVVRLGVQAGVPEVTLLPHLSLQGELTAKHPESSSKASSLNESLDLNLGGAETWSFAVPGSNSADGGQSFSGGSPIQNTMKGFQSTVYSAADEVETLLTRYHQTLANVKTLKQTHENASEAARLALQQFQVDRIDGSYVTNAQMRRVEAGQALAKSQANLASIAISLLVATGSECYPDRDPATAYQAK